MTSATQEDIDSLSDSLLDEDDAADSARSVLARAFSLLQAFTADRPVLSLGELATYAGLPKSTTHRIAATLVGCGALHRHGRLGYSIGAWLHDVGMLSPVRAHLLAASSPFVHELHAQTHATVHVGVLSPTGPVYLDKIAASDGPTIFTRPGSSFPIHATAVGKCLLAMSPEATAEILDGPPLRRFTRRTLATPAQLAAALDRIRSENIAYDREETVNGISCIAAPIMDRNGRSVAAISVCAPTTRINERRTILLVQRTAAKVERALGREVSATS